MKMTVKQKEFWKNAVIGYHRWNVCSGATRSGKTYLSYFYIPKKTIELIHKDGLAVILGNTHATVERNILEPMRAIWGDDLVGKIGSNNKVTLFGQLFHVVGAEKRTGTTKIQGQAIKLCIGDEVATWHEDVFNMLKSRLDKEYSCFYGTCNPDHPKHWFKEFLDSNADIYHTHFTLDDNDYLPVSFKEALKEEYAGTVYYYRFILGQWVRAEGIIYQKFSANPEKYLWKKQKLQEINIGVDFGGTKSGQAFVATGVLPNYGGIVALKSERHFGDIDPDKLEMLFVEFVEAVIDKYGRVDYAYCDSAESVLIRGLKKAAEAARLPITIKNATKKPIIDRIRATISLINRERMFVTDDCETLTEALQDAVWDETQLEDIRLDDGTTDIDSLDAFEYSWERYIKHLIDRR